MPGGLKVLWCFLLLTFLEIFLNTNYTNINDVRNYQLQLILDDINNNLGIEKLILIGHHPIMFTKKKDGETKYDSDIPLFVDVLKIIKNERIIIFINCKESSYVIISPFPYHFLDYSFIG